MFGIFSSGGSHDQYFPAGRVRPIVRQAGERRRYRGVDRPRSRQGSACAARRRQDGGPRHDRRSRRQDRHRDVARPGGARAAAPRRGARAGPGGPGTLSRHADHVRPGDGGRVLLRLRARRAVLVGGLRQDRAAHGRDRRPQPADHARGVGPRQDQGLLQEARRELQGRVGRRTAQGRGDHGLQAGRLARHVPRPAPAVDGQARQGVQAHEGVGRLLARRRQERPAPARLRHDLLLRQGAEGLPASHRGSREARPPPDRPRDGPVPSAGRLGRHGLLASQGLDVLAHARELPAAQARGRRLCRGEDAAAQRPQAVGGVGPLGEVPREHVSQRERGRPARVHCRSGTSASSR